MMLINEVSIEEEINEVQAGEEVEKIDAWNSYYDELDELKKVFYEFLKRWVSIDTKTLSEVNKPLLY